MLLHRWSPFAAWFALSQAIWAFSRLAGRATHTGPPAIFTTLGRGRGLFWGWLHFAGRWQSLGPPARAVWTDDYASVLPYLTWGSFL